MDSPRIEELRRRVLVDPASIAFAALAEEYRRTGRYEEAIAVCRTGLARHPSYISAHVTLGRALIEVGRYDDAREELAHVLRAAPENLAAIRGLEEIHERQSQAAAAPQPAIDVRPNASPPTPAIPVESHEPPAPPAPDPVTLVDAVVPQGEDPARERLEAFLQAILRARDSAGGIHAS